MPEMNHAYAEVDGKPVLVKPEHVEPRPGHRRAKSDGTRQLLVPSIKAAEEIDFRQFWVAYEDVVRKARSGKLGVDDFQGTTISLTNPGTIGTVHSVPRLMPGQGTIIGVGAMEYPAEYQGAVRGHAVPPRDQQGHDAHLHLRPPDHPGRPVGRLPAPVHQLLLGEDGFYDEIFECAADPLRAGPLGPGHLGHARRRRGQVGPGHGADPRLPGPWPPDGRHRPARVPRSASTPTSTSVSTG